MKAKHCHIFPDTDETGRDGSPSNPPTAPNTPSAADVNDHWIALNIARKTRDLKPLSLAYLALIASNSEAIPGEAFCVSKSTVAAVLKGDYKASTEPAIRARLFHCIVIKFKDLGLVFPDSIVDSADMIARSTSTKLKSIKSLRTAINKPRTPRLVITRCGQAGYLTHNKLTYYLGTDFAGRLCTITSMRDRKDKGIRFTTIITNLELTATITGTAYPIDPSTSQLGYKAEK